jgi:hypothetical protein
MALNELVPQQMLICVGSFAFTSYSQPSSEEERLSAAVQQRVLLMVYTARAIMKQKSRRG